MNRLSVLAILIVASFACGKLAPLPAKPQLIVDRDSLGFGLEFGSATFIGTSAPNAILISNQGQADLIIAKTEFDGGGVFSIEGPVKTTLKSKENTFIRVLFAPTAEKNYAGFITLTSNAENFPVKTVGLSGAGRYCIKLVVTDGGAPCTVTYYCDDGGTKPPQPSVNCGQTGEVDCWRPLDAGVISTCTYIAVTPDSGVLARPNLCGLSDVDRAAAFRNVCAWSL